MPIDNPSRISSSVQDGKDGWSVDWNENGGKRVLLGGIFEDYHCQEQMCRKCVGEAIILVYYRL
jgi:hypothetical protein